MAALQASQQREHRHREHRHRSSRPTDAAQTGSNGAPIILSPAAAQVKDRDRERVRRSHTTPTRGETRELSMSVQPIAPASRHASHIRERDASGAVTPATHPYASASATPTPSTPIRDGGAGGTYGRTTSNSPLPPIPGDERGERENALTAGQSGSNVALNAQPAPGQTYPHPSGAAAASVPSMPRGMSAQRVDGIGYDTAPQAQEEQPRRRGFLALLCCRA